MKLLFWRGKMSKVQFRDRFMEAVQQAHPSASVRPDEDLGVVVEGLDQKRTHNIWLENAYEEFTKTPDQIEDIFRRWLAPIAEAGVSLSIEERLSSIVPMVKGRQWLEVHQSAGFNGWFEEYNSQLLVAYAEFRNGISFLSNEEAETFGKSREELRRLALDNLRSRTRGRDVIGGDGRYLIGVGGNLEASLLLDHELWRDGRLQIRGERIIGIPDRDSFLVVGSDSPAQVFEAAAMVHRLYRSERYPVCDQLFIWTGARFDPLDEGSQDDEHPIPKLDVIDVLGKRNDRGAQLVLVIASQLSADPRSIYRLFKKMSAYRSYVSSDEYAQEFGVPEPASTTIEISLHREPDPAVRALLDSLGTWIGESGASFLISNK